MLTEQGPTAPLLLLCTARPEFRPQWPLRAHHTQLTLNRLSARNVREMIAQVACPARRASGYFTLEFGSPFVRTSRTALSMRACNSSGSVSALRAFISWTVQRKMWARTASSMSFDSPPFLRPRELRKLRTVRFGLFRDPDIPTDRFLFHLQHLYPSAPTPMHLQS